MSIVEFFVSFKIPNTRYFSQISSTVMDSPTINMYQRWNQQGLLGQSPSNFYNGQEYSPWNNFGNLFYISDKYISF